MKIAQLDAPATAETLASQELTNNSFHRSAALQPAPLLSAIPRSPSASPTNWSFRRVRATRLFLQVVSYEIILLPFSKRNCRDVQLCREATARSYLRSKVNSVSYQAEVNTPVRRGSVVEKQKNNREVSARRLCLIFNQKNFNPCTLFLVQITASPVGFTVRNARLRVLCAASFVLPTMIDP